MKGRRRRNRGRDESQALQTGNSLNVTGIFRSGTNLFRALMETHYDCRIAYDTMGWKHAPVPLEASTSELSYPQRGVVFIIKDPFSLLSSLFEFAFKPSPHFKSHGEAQMQSFLRSPVVLRARPRQSRGAELYFDTPLAMLNTYYWNYASTVRSAPARMLIVRYEDMVSDPAAATGRVAELFGLKLVDADVKLPNERTRNMRAGVHEPDRFFGAEPFDLDRVLSRGFMSDFSADDQRLVSESLNAELFAELGYGLALSPG